MLRKLFRLFRPKPIAAPDAPAPAYGFIGDYPSFEAAETDATGYETEGYSVPVANSLRTLIAAPPYVALDERFIQVHSALSYIAQREDAASLRVLDYGGGSGVYAKVMRQLMPRTSLDWTVLESPAVVAACEQVEDSPARYASSAEGQRFDVAILSGTLQYLREPWTVLEETAKFARWIILTRLPVVEGDNDRVTLQKVPPHLYEASMPVWLLSEKKLRAWIGGKLVLEWIVSPDAGLCAMASATPKGFLILV